MIKGMREPFRLSLLVACLSMMCACVSTEWSFTRQGPAIPELCAARSLGIAVFDPVLKPNEHPLVRTGGAFYCPVDIDGVTHTVALLVPAPEAATRFAGNQENLARVCLQVWEREIGTAHRFDYPLSRGLMLARLLGQTAEGDAVPTGYDTVRAVPERLSRAGATEVAVRDLCRQYGLDALLAVEPSISAEVGQVSSCQSEHSLGKEIDPGNFILRAQVTYEYVLFDGNAGTVITDSTRSTPQYDTQQPPESSVFDLGPSNPRATMSLLNGPGFLGRLTWSMQEALKPYLTLFRCCIVAVPQKR